MGNGDTLVHSAEIVTLDRSGNLMQPGVKMLYVGMLGKTWNHLVFKNQVQFEEKPHSHCKGYRRCATVWLNNLTTAVPIYWYEVGGLIPGEVI
jgi:hypothetical protein